ncbi:MAG: two-component system response regulator [Firmicutes bacterium HGW-Firmicutes-1]|jgi:two-component system chemotaxis response regulator CheY|nr:MAG: two-component system response regulator [Firmicutes bacterium HGW-Firmicutes-1]
MENEIKILVCDDSMTVRKKLVQSLNTIQPCIVFEADNGVTAVQAYEQNTPDLVFMDIMMPEKDGLQAVTEIIELDPSAKIVMLSSVGTKSNLKKALEVGAVDFLQKPCEEDKLRNLLNTYGRKE